MLGFRGQLLGHLPGFSKKNSWKGPSKFPALRSCGCWGLGDSSTLECWGLGDSDVGGWGIAMLGVEGQFRPSMLGFRGQFIGENKGFCRIFSSDKVLPCC